MQRYRVRLFAAHREAAGRSVLEVELPAGACVADLLAELETQVPALSAVRLPSVVAVNGEFVDGGRTLRAHDEVALFPPVAGG